MRNKQLTNMVLTAVITAGVIAPLQAASKEKYHDVSAAFQNNAANFANQSKFDGERAEWNNTSIRSKSILIRKDKKR